MPRPVYTADRQVWRDGDLGEGTRLIPEETAMALTYNGGTYAVMMGTPQDLRGLCRRLQPQRRHRAIAGRDRDARHRRSSTTASSCGCGWRLRSAERVNERRRHIAGPTGCGICGVEFDCGGRAARRDRAEAARTFAPHDIMAAMAGIAPLQAINIETRAVHAAAFWTPARGIVALREDVGRHNALDKLAGALALAEVSASDGIVLLTSRVSVEMVQKTAAIGAPADGRGVGADRARGAHSGCRRHHARRDRAIRRFRSFHASGADCGLTEYRRCGGYPCRLIG